MGATNRDIQLVHPLFQKNMDKIIEAITKKLPTGFTCKMVSGHRTPAEQFDLYKQGRSFKNGNWVKDSSKGGIVTNINGITKLSNHNYLPCVSIDMGVFDANGKYLSDAKHYKHVKEGAKLLQADWGGDWATFKDTPHIELSKANCFKNNIIREVDYQWQLLLAKDGTYKGALDGFFGTKCFEALQKSTGFNVRNIESWKKLVKKVGIN
jgi:peptidoglycan L-alanyl-D-glutamate endopeptidase CwlK